MSISLDPNDKPSVQSRQPSVSSEQEVANNGELKEVPESVLQDLMSTVQKAPDEFDVIQEVIPIPLQMFWDNFFADEAQYSLGDFLAERGEKNIDMGKWRVDDNPVEEVKGEEDKVDDTPAESADKPDEGNIPVQPPSVESSKKSRKLTRELNFTVAVKGVPF